MRVFVCSCFVLVCGACVCICVSLCVYLCMRVRAMCICVSVCVRMPVCVLYTCASVLRVCVFKLFVSVFLPQTPARHSFDYGSASSECHRPPQCYPLQVCMSNKREGSITKKPIRDRGTLSHGSTNGKLYSY